MATKKNPRALSSRASGTDPKAAKRREPPLTEALAAPPTPPVADEQKVVTGKKPVKTVEAKRREKLVAKEDRRRARMGLPKRTAIKPRHFDHSANWLKLKNRDPNKKYVFASQSSHDTGVDYYAELGYQVEETSEHGVGLGATRVKRKSGADIEMRGMTLMSISCDDYEEMVEFGEDGNTGQAQADIMERKISKGFGSENNLHREIVEGARLASYDAELEA